MIPVDPEKTVLAILSVLLNAVVDFTIAVLPTIRRSVWLGLKSLLRDHFSLLVFLVCSGVLLHCKVLVLDSIVRHILRILGRQSSP